MDVKQFVVTFFSVAHVVSLFAARSVNVRDFGAVGDGVSDDTLAIQRAADSLRSKDWDVLGRDCIDVGKRARSGWVYDGASGEVFFPKGIYKVTGPIMFQYRLNVRGERGAVIRNVSPKEDTFYFHLGYRVLVEGLSFEGGFIQLRQWTNNMSDSLLFISDCTFSGAYGTAVVSDSFRIADGKKADYDRQKSCPPYEITRDKDKRVRLKRVDKSILTGWPNSTQVIVENCHFKNNMCAFDIVCDGGIVRDCLVEAGPEVSVAACVGNTMHLNRVRFSTVGNPSLEKQCILQARRVSALLISDCEFRSRGDMVAIESTAKACSGEVAKYITLKNLMFDTGKAPVMRFGAGTFPNMIVIDGINSARCLKVPQKFFSFERVPDVDEIVCWTKENSKKSVWGHPVIAVNKCFGVEVSNFNEMEFDTALPNALEQFRRKSVADKRRKIAMRLSPLPDYREKEAEIFSDDRIGCDLYGKDNSDDSKLLQGLLDKAALRPAGATVVLPPKWIHIGKSINVSGRVRVVSRGRAFITANDGIAAFRIAEGSSVTFENIAVHLGENAIVCAGSQGELRIRNCGFFAQKSESILAVAESESAWRIEMTGGSCLTPLLYRGNASPFLIDGFWHSVGAESPIGGPHRKSFASIVNLSGGYMLASDVLGVPGYFYERETYHAKKDKSLIGDYRWIDNYGDMVLLQYRMGAEHGGLTPIYHYEGASSYVEGKYVTHIGNWRLRDRYADACVFCDNPDLTFIDVIGVNFFQEPSFNVRRIRNGTSAELISGKTFNCYPYLKETK